jgi:hypothetical protein
MKEKPFALVGVNCDNQQVLMNLVERKVVTWRTFADGAGGPIATEWEINSFPNLYLVDHNGIVRRLFRGVPSEESLQEAIATLVREAEQAKQNGS